MAFILSTDSLPASSRAVLERWEIGNIDSEDDIAKATVLLTWSGWLSKGQVSKMKALQAIQVLSAGVDDVPFSLIPDNVRVFSNAGAYSTAVSEHAWALVLALAKETSSKDPQSYVLSGKTLAVIGCGGIGSRVAAVGRAFNMRVIGLSRSFESPEYFEEKYESLTSDLSTVLKIADVIVLALPLNKSSMNLLTYEKLMEAKNTVMIVNIARAELMEEKVMQRFLVERPRARFATDVFWRKNGKENFDSNLFKLNNFLGTKHRAGSGSNSELRDAAMLAAANNVRKFLETGKASNEVRREDYLKK